MATIQDPKSRTLVYDVYLGVKRQQQTDEPAQVADKGACDGG